MAGDYKTRFTVRLKKPVIFLAGQAAADHPIAIIITHTMASPPWLMFRPWVNIGPMKIAHRKPAATLQTSSEKRR